MQIEYENLFQVNKPYCDDLERSFSEVLHSGWYILGNKVSEFESAFSEYLNVKHCIGVASGLDALILSMVALDLGPGAEVIVPSNTYIATVIAVIKAGYKPVLVEPDIKTYNIDPQRISAAVTKNTKAVLVVHLYGKPCDMDPIRNICEDHQLYLLEDCAQSHGAAYQGKKTGTFGELAAFSFYPTKNLGCLGDGGAIVTDDQHLYDKLRSLRNYGSDRKYQNKYIGFNSRLDEIQAAFLLVKLKALDRINEHKKNLANLYFNGLDTRYILPVQQKGYDEVFHIFNVRYSKRDQLKEFLLNNQIKTEIHYPIAPHKQEALAGLTDLVYPISEEIHETTLSLPISACHSVEDIGYVIETMNQFQ